MVSCDIRKYKCKGIRVCPKRPKAYREQTHCNVDPSSNGVIRSAEMQSLDAMMLRRAEEIYRELTAKETYCRFSTVSQTGSRVGVMKCPGKPKIFTSRRASISGKRDFSGVADLLRWETLHTEE